jgi:hypothetical protein
MRRIAPILKSAAFAAATVAALGFGAAQAFAGPRSPAAEAACSSWACRNECGSLGGQWVPKDGRCYCCG